MRYNCLISYLRRYLIHRVQVIHPFYVFQIASIILWSLDDYYYYAFCIALISALSVSTTLFETKKVRFYDCSVWFLFSYFICQTIARMREMSRFSCPVTVLVNGACKMPSCIHI